jgi:Rab GTPase-binding effector protein 1
MKVKWQNKEDILYVFILQIQLEKIRQAETEVRWQHEEDVDECSNCKQQFSVTKRKVMTGE